MVYTVGHTENYKAAIAANGVIQKTGKREGYQGGIIFQNVEDAKRYLDETGNADIWSVWGVDAEWGVDTKPTGVDDWYWHWLTRHSDIIPLDS